MVDGFERGLLPAIETLTELDLGDRARTKVSKVSGIGTVIVTSSIVDIVTTIVPAVIHVGVIGRRAVDTGVRDVSRRVNTTTTTTVGTKGEGVRLRSKRDSSLRSRVEEQVRIVGRVLSLDQTI